MYCTGNNITQKAPKTNETQHTARYITYPDKTGKRTAEGGLRTRGQYKTPTKNKPLLSIITVVYNGEKNIERCMRSVLCQNYDFVEYIIIDGASTDGTMDIVKRYEDAIDYYISEPDEGIYDAMNKGIALAQGDAINFMNADDYFVENIFLNYIETLFSNECPNEYPNECPNECKVVYAQANVTNEMGEILFVEKTMAAAFVLKSIVHQSMFVKKEMFEEFGVFDTSYKIAADYCFLLSMYLKYGIERFRYIDTPTVFYELSGVSFTNTDTAKKEFLHIYMEKFGMSTGLPPSFFEAVCNMPVSAEDLEKAMHILKDKIYHLHEYEASRQAILLDMMKAVLCIMPDRLHYIKEQISVLEYNPYYRFGQMSKLRKIKTVLLFPLRSVVKCIYR